MAQAAGKQQLSKEMLPLSHTNGLHTSNTRCHTYMILPLGDDAVIHTLKMNTALAPHLDEGHFTERNKTQGDEQRAKSTKVDSALNVSASRYAGDAFLGGQHEAELTVVHDAKNQSQPLFRWMHMVQPILDFEDFLKKIEETESLSQAELHALKKLFTQVKREAVRSRLTPEGKSVGHMDPKTLRVAIPADESRPAPQGSNHAGSRERHITWACIPYFSLETYTDSSAVQSKTQFPVETLLQNRFARTSKAREKQQVVWQRGQSGGDECFHIAQLWCVIVDKCKYAYPSDLSS
ncbi:Mg2+ transporter [Apiospora arundinis]